MTKEEKAARIPIGRNRRLLQPRETATRKKDNSLAARLAEVKIAKEQAHLERIIVALLQEKGTLVKKDQIIHYVTTCNTLVMSRLLSLPDKIAPRLVGEPVERVAEVLRDELRELCEALANEGLSTITEPDYAATIDNEIGLVLDDMEAETSTDSH